MRLVAFLTVLALALPYSAATLTDPLQNDAGSGGDAGDTEDTATALHPLPGSIGQSGRYTGQTFLVDDPQDWYSFQVYQPGAPISLVFETAGTPCIPLDVPFSLASTVVVLRDPAHDEQARLVLDSCHAGGRLFVERAQLAGRWTIGVSYQSSTLAAGTPVGASMRVGPPSPAPIEPPAATGPSLEQTYDLDLTCKPSC